MDETATLPAEGVVSEPQSDTSQEPQAEPQGTTEVQPAVTDKVESVEQTPASQEPARSRPKPSEYYKQRQKIQSLERKLDDAMRSIEAMRTKTATPQEPRNYEKEFYEKPFPTMLDVIDNILEQKLTNTFKERDKVSMRQAGLDIIRNSEYVKTDGDEAIERIQEILKEKNGRLDKMGETDPVGAAELALEIYEKRFPKQKPVEKSPLAPPNKGRMVSTQTGTPTAPKETKMEDYLSELKTMREKLLKDPSQRNDPAYKQRVEQIRAKLAEIQNQG